MRGQSILVLTLLALAAGDCSRALAPAQDRNGTARSAAGLAAEPGPQQPLPDEGGSPTPAPCPSATFTVPRPSHFFSPILPPTFTFQWAPNVPALPGPVPTRYRYRLFDENGSDFDFITILVKPDSLLRFYAPGFAGWTEVSGSVTQATLSDMDPQQAHVIVLIAMDDHGHFDNALSFDRNMVYFHVSPALVVDRGDDGTR